jgi:LPXTG-motif cell wall-anchored protein
VAGMVAQSWAHLLLLGFIILGNLGYFVAKRRKN